MSRRIQVKLFGAFRQYGGDGHVSVALTDDATVNDLRKAFGEQLDDDNARALLQSSAFATDEAVLEEHEPVPMDSSLSILPPVCGG